MGEVLPPNLLIAGAQKGGTTWLHANLAHHPDVFMSAKKEINFFNNPRHPGDDHAWLTYLEHFAAAGPVAWRGESTPHYFWHQVPGPFSPEPTGHDTARFIAESLAEVRVLVLLRDPVSRAVSAYHHNNYMGRVPEGHGLFRLPPSMGLVDLGFYSRHWAHWSEALGADRLTAFVYDDLAADPDAFLRSVLTALQLDTEVPEFWESARRSKVNRRRRAEVPATISPQEVAALHELYRDEVGFVEDLLGRDLSAWRDLDALIARHTVGYGEAPPGRPAPAPAPRRGLRRVKRRSGQSDR